MIFACKKCRKVFRKDMEQFDESDEYCPHCDNHFLLEAKEPQARLEVEGEDIRKDSRMIRDDRIKRKEAPTVWDDEGEAARLGWGSSMLKDRPEIFRRDEMRGIDTEAFGEAFW
jgi:hypothetical protein